MWLFSTLFSVFHLVMKRGVSCLIYYFQVKVNMYIVSTNYERFIYLWTFEKSDFLYFEASEA